MPEAEKELDKEMISSGELLSLWHPGTKGTFSGYGLVTKDGKPDFLVGLLVVDCPELVDSEWLGEVEEVFGSYDLVPISIDGERAIVCQMQIEPESLPFLRRFQGPSAAGIRGALAGLLEVFPRPAFTVRWDERAGLWTSQLAVPTKLSLVEQRYFKKNGYGCLPRATNIGTMHLCYAASTDISRFESEAVGYQWLLVKMPTAPLIRFQAATQGDQTNTHQFESILYIAQPDHLTMLLQLADQARLYFVLYGDDLKYHFTKIVGHAPQQRQALEKIVFEAMAYQNQIPRGKRDYHSALVEYQRRSF
ncbi:hypothetical protein ACFLZP_01755 [Patescibacteria group bacterium]